MKILVACVDMIPQNLGRQPWFYMNSIAEGLAEEGHEVWILTDKEDGNRVDGRKYIVLHHFRSFPKGIHRDLIPILEKEKFDLLFWSTGLTDFLYQTKIDILKIPVIAVVTSPRYSLKELASFGRSIFLEWTLIKPFFLSPLILKSKIHSFLNMPNLKAVVFECGETLARYVCDKADRGKCVVIPPHLPEDFLSLLKSARHKKNGPRISPKVLYFGPPLYIRGIDTVIHAFAEVREKIANIRLEILSRIEDEKLQKHESFIRRLIEKNSLNANIAIISGLLSREEIIEYLSTADAICLPFKGVVSDVPIVVLEALAIGTPLITTSVAGVADYAKHGRCRVVPPGDPHSLAEAIAATLTEPYREGERGPDIEGFLAMHERKVFIASMKQLLENVA